MLYFKNNDHKKATSGYKNLLKKINFKQYMKTCDHKISQLLAKTTTGKDNCHDSYHI